MNGMKGLSASFLEEVFGGLVSETELSSEQVRQVLRFTPEDNYLKLYIDIIKSYIAESDCQDS